MDKRIRGTYKIDTNKTPQENITEILKKTMPVRLTLNKLQEGANSSNQENFKMNGVSITAIGNYRWSSCTEINDFKRIHFEMRLPGRHWGRSWQRNWSVPIKVKENGEKRISFSAVTNVFNELMKLYSDGEKEENQREEKEQLAKENLNEIKQKSNMPNEVNLNHERNSHSNQLLPMMKDWRLDNTEKTKNKVPKYQYTISLSLRELDEEQIIKMGSLFQEIIKIKKLIQK